MKYYFYAAAALGTNTQQQSRHLIGPLAHVAGAI